MDVAERLSALDSCWISGVLKLLDFRGASGSVGFCACWICWISRPREPRP
jgi:hypothetical protein